MIVLLSARLPSALLLIVLFSNAASAADDLMLSLRFQKETSPGSGRYHRLHRDAAWKPEETAVIVCDVWDLHHSLNAVRRVEEFAPRLNKLLKAAAFSHSAFEQFKGCFSVLALLFGGIYNCKFSDK